jgi:hypothetical protein
MKLVLGLVCLISITADAQNNSRAKYRQRVEALRIQVQQQFTDRASGYYKEFNYRDSNDKKKYSYLWPLCGLIQAADENDRLFRGASFFDTVLHAIQAYYDDAPPAPGYNAYLLKEGKEERFYDDNQWIGIAAMDAYNRTNKEAYLEQGKLIYRFMMTGFDTAAGGGLYWKEGDWSTKNTCSNGPGVLLALQLYRSTRQQFYLDTALLLYNWVNNKLLSPQGVYFDHVMLPSGKLDTRLYTYNAGTMLQASVLLYEITKEKKYLQVANRIAAAAYAIFFKRGRWPDHYWFNAVLLRGYEALLKHNKERRYIQAFVQDGEAIWQKERSADKLVGKHRKKNLLDQAAMMEIYGRLARLVQ